MRTRFLLAATAVALMAGTLAGASPAAAQAGWTIQRRDYNESMGLPMDGPRDYGYGHHYYRGYRSFAFAPHFWVGPRYRYHRYWRHW